MDDDWMTLTEFAKVAHRPENTVRYWRHIGYGPKGFKLGRRVLYSQREVREWIQAVRAEQSSEPA